MAQKRKICALITARDGSKGLKRKNLQKIGGKTLIEIAIELAITADLKVIISTDIPELVNGISKPNVCVYKRPAQLCEGDTQIEEVIKDAIQSKKIEGDIVLLQPTSPLRQYNQLIKIIDLYYRKMPSLCLSGTVEDSSVLKSYVMHEGSYKSINKREYLFKNRQELPRVLRPNGAFYIFNAQTFLKNGFDTSNIQVFEMDKTSSIDIDSYDDLVKVRNLKID